MIRYGHLHTPIGRLGLVTVDGQLTRVHFLRECPADEVARRLKLAADAELCPDLGGMVERFGAYFSGELSALDDARCAPSGTAFQKQVWGQLRRIPAGKTRSYGEIAAALNKPGAARAVGAANGANPIPLVIPCHRVIGADGRLTGFSSGVDLKRWLLRHEGVLGESPQLGLQLDPRV